MSGQGVIVSGLGGASALGSGVAAQVAAMNDRRSCLRPLAQHPEAAGTCPELLAGWMDDRSWLSGRKYGGASNASIRAARMAAEDAGWTPEDVADCHVFSGTSRGNTGELFGTWKARGPVRRLSTSNSMHSETASAVSIELGIRGPWLTLSNGCSSGLDALALAFLTLQNALARVFHDATQPTLSLHFMKPFTGHSLGARGVVDAVLLCAFLRQQSLPPNLPGLTTPDSERFTAPDTCLPFDPESCLLTIVAGMGGRNTVVAFGIQQAIP